MATSYPGGLDDFAEITSQRQDQAVGGRDHRQMHNDLGDAVEAIQTELGTDPAGSSDTVKARIAAAETAISGKAATSHTHTEGDVTGLTAALAGKASTTELEDEAQAREDADDALAAQVFGSQFDLAGYASYSDEISPSHGTFMLGLLDKCESDLDPPTLADDLGANDVYVVLDLTDDVDEVPAGFAAFGDEIVEVLS